MIIVKNGSLCGVRDARLRDLVVGGGKIIAFGESIDSRTLPGETEVLDAGGDPVTPGFIDGHQHFTGGGGEGGFKTRAPEIDLSMNSVNGVTTAVGLLGTDALTRSVRNLYAKTRALAEEGLSAFMLTGAYWHPSPTVTGSVSDDIVYLDRCLGVKIALSDVRGPILDAEDLAKLAAEVRVAALLAGKPGIITVHVGIKRERLELVRRTVEDYGIRADTFVLTHVNRKDDRLLDQALRLAEQGAWLDATAMEAVPRPGSAAMTAADFAVVAGDAGLWDRVSVSTDAGGSLPRWDKDHGKILGMSVASPVSLRIELARLVNEKGLDLERAIQPMTTTPARIYGFEERKGRLAAEADADILVLERETLRPRHVVANGRILVKDFKPIVKGFFEE